MSLVARGSDTKPAANAPTKAPSRCSFSIRRARSRAASVSLFCSGSSFKPSILEQSPAPTRLIWIFDGLMWHQGQHRLNLIPVRPSLVERFAHLLLSGDAVDLSHSR